MKILLLSDIESESLWEYFDKSKVSDYSLILSAGDLRSDYLSFLATMVHVPVLYVHGNHDTRSLRRPPEGCICIEDTVFEYQGVRILGLGGSMRYRLGDCQYTEKEMSKRIAKLRRPIRKARGFDILLTHSPAQGLGDGTDLPHQGFQCFLDLMDRYHPAYMIHGHVHMNYGYRIPRIQQYGTTKVVNCYEKWEIDFPASEL